MKECVPFLIQNINFDAFALQSRPEKQQQNQSLQDQNFTTPSRLAFSPSLKKISLFSLNFLNYYP
jgi:hypothetical protein